MSKPRVLLFGRYADEDFGGLERHVRTLVQALHKDVAYTDLVAWRWGIPQDENWACPVYRSRALAVVVSVPLCPGMPLAARRLQRKYRFDIAHLHLPDPMAHLAALALPPQVRLVITWHSDIVRQRMALALYKPFLRRLMARAAAVIAPTPAHFASMPQLAEMTEEAQRVVVPFGFDLSHYSAPDPRARVLRDRDGRKIVFALGRHVYYKGFEYLIRAMGKVPGARLLLGGTGPLTQRLKSLARELGLLDRVEFVGRVPEDELPAYYQACDVFCLPAVEQAEAFGIVQVEAMAAGKPVLCTLLNNGVNWVNPDGVTGLAVAPRDPDALASALNRLLADANLRRKLGEAGRVRAESHFSLEALRAGTLAVYRKVLGR